ncbi:helix-turn-helix domain-containing protein [Streptomyces paludis]|uniref:Helix-turn-helix domain-containing protein n=1 Tax=Streptomyces paludis TaxID=2282738 RepID=A0A345HPM8_9ACTN|nr:helix-turn-helix domain-containing protein [Streptomyces paludis]AXG78652.1 helix-turn-helix domain-containing protein [Streptomyces paludis]
MDANDISAPPHSPSGLRDSQRPARANPRPGVRPSASPDVRPAGIEHDNSRHTERFTVIGNHLAQHDKLSLVAMGLGLHIQSLPTGARVDIKTLAGRFPEGPTRIAAGLRELEAHGYLRRLRERTPGGRIVTRTISCNQPAAAAVRHHRSGGATTAVVRRTAPPDTCAEPARPAPPAPRKKRPLPDVPQPGYSSPDLLGVATAVLADLRVHDPRLLLSACDTAHLAPGVAAWLERDVAPAAVRQALISDLPAEALRRPAALLAYRLADQLPPAPPFRAPAAVRYPLRNCDHCDRGYRGPEPGCCGDCRERALLN